MTTMTRGAPAPSPAPPYLDARTSILQNAGALVNLPFFVPNAAQTGVGSPQFLAGAASAGGGTATAILDGLIAAVQLNVAPLGAGIIRYPPAQPAGPLIAGAGSWPRSLPTYRVGMRVRRSAIGGNCGHNSGLIMGWDSLDVNGLPAPPLMRNGCFGIVGDAAGGWAFVAASGGVELTNQALQWPVATDLYADAELRFVPPTLTSPGSVEVWVGDIRQLSYPIGGANLPPVAVAAGTFGLNFSLFHLVNGAVAPDLIVSEMWVNTLQAA